MAEDCISVTFEDGRQWDYCWEDGHPDPGWSSDDVVTGLRPSQGAQSRGWRTCQYYLKGMASICKNWKEGASSDEEDTVTSGSFFCSYVKENTPDDPNDPPPETPTGFNHTHCDFLGRRQWCSKYEESAPHQPEEWICAAPNPYVTGVGDKSIGEEAAIFTPVARDRILGYNDANDGTGTGKCDCYGMGRGADGCLIQGTDDLIEKNLSKLPIACNFYRPYQMGFGIIDPDGKIRGDVEDDLTTITDQGWKRAKAWEDAPETRLPLNYELYNTIAQFQKCQWWNEDTARKFYEKDGYLYLTGDDSIFDSTTGRVEFCTSTDTSAVPFNSRVLTSTTSGIGALHHVWALGGGPVCNGARVECPLYSGKWIYLRHEKMLPGMPVTANQILELRFWAQDWDNQDDYNKYYLQKPNFDDPGTEAIYTFTKWDKPTSELGDSKMKGKRLTLCQPAPLHQKEFIEDYILEEPADYYQQQIGTSTEGNQRHFPSLIRNPQFPDLKPLVVIYPYYNDDVFDVDMCVQPGEAGHIKKHNDIYGDEIRVVGQTIRNKKVYVINTAEIPVDTLLRDFSGVYGVRGKKVENLNAEAIKNNIYNILRETVSRGIKDNPDYIKDTTSDNVSGFFAIDPVKLNYNEQNLLLICVDYGDGTWEYRWREVISKWCGGIIKQIDYLHEYGNDEDGYSNSQPESLDPSASATAKAVFLNGVTDVDIISTYSYENALTSIRYYDWSIQEVIIEDELQQYWAAVGNSNKIWVELDDTDINYVYAWDVESAYLKVIMKESEADEDGNTEESHPRGETIPDEIELKKILVDDDHIPPNACLLEPVDDIRIRFLTSEWELYVTYKHQQLTNENTSENIIYGANKSNTDRYRESSYSISGENLISVDGINNGSVQMMAHFKDEDDRIISAFATKLLTNIIRESCRSIDIFYRYEAEGRQYKLMPETGMCIDIKQDLVMRDLYKHVEIPNCGDHEHSWYTWEGPMWFPFNSCRGYDMYDEWTICNNCQAGYTGPMNDGVKRDDDGEIMYAGGQVIMRNDYRYCGPYKYHAFGDVRGNWAAACDCGCRFWYSDASFVTPIFAGYSRIKTTVNLEEYASYDWVPPPFGNDGRELVEKFISQDFVSHSVPFTTIESPLPVRSEWMPLMLDHSIFFSTFNAYDDNPEDEYMGITEYYGLEPFRYTNQLNMGLLAAIKETIVTGRFRWEELFEVHHEGNCSYPYPIYSSGGSSTKALFYYLKNDWDAWAWQEDWKNIERNVAGEMPETESEEVPDTKVTDMDKLDFFELVRPLYIFDVYKAEHRRIIDEGKQLIVYKGPVLDEDGNMEEYPSLSINGTNERPFEILYDEDSYISTNSVNWKDEGGDSKTSASSDEDNIYEETGGSNWVHHEDILFDAEAVPDIDAAEAADRKVAVSVDFDGNPSYKYFNRGLIVNMTRDRLYNLPKVETEQDIDLSIEVSDSNEGGIPGTIVWNRSSATITTEFEEKVAIAKIHINGNWGYSEVPSEETGKIVSHKLVLPGVSVTCDFEDGSSGEPRSQVSPKSEITEPAEGQGVETYDIYLYFVLGPVEMLEKRVNELSINFSGVADSFMSINAITLYVAEYVDVMYEWVNVWERKYISSTFSDVGGDGINLDGPDDNLHYQTDLNNSGQYVDFRGQKFHDREFAAIDKTKTVAAGIRYASDVSIEITYDNLHEIERTEQRDLYEYAYDLDPSSDSLTYAFIIPYKYKNFLEDLGIQFPGDDLIITSEKLPWEKYQLFKQFVQYDYWRPGGHFYAWNSRFTKQKCWSFGQPDDFFTAFYAHVDHVGIGNPLEVDPSEPIDPGNSYYSLRFYTQQAKYDRAMILAGGDPEYNDRMSGVTPYNGGTFI